MVNKGHTGLRRVVYATVYSWQGFKAAFKHEAAFRQELAVVILALPLAFIIADTGVELLLLTAPLLLMLLAELVNSAIEAVVDRVGEEHHELAGRAKDMGSASTFVSFVIVGFSWIVIVVEKYIF